MNKLTSRETETLRLIAEGLSNKEIAARLNISPHTAKFHVANTCRKMGTTTRVQAAVAYVRALGA